MRRVPTMLALGLLAASIGPVRAEEPEEATAAAQAAETLALNPLSALDKATLDGFRDAPLFTPSRTRPAPPPEPEVVAEAPPPAPEPVEETPPEPPTLKLAGIVQGPDGAVAFVSKDGETETEQLRLGDQIDGWLVSAIDPATLKLTLDEREQEYRMFLPAPQSGGADASNDDGSDSSSDSDETSSSDDSDASSDEQETGQQPSNAQKSGAQHEMEAARRAQQESRKRQLNRPDPQPPMRQLQQRQGQ